jgi:hypothetical protein
VTCRTHQGRGSLKEKKLGIAEKAQRWREKRKLGSKGYADDGGEGNNSVR